MTGVSARIAASFGESPNCEMQVSTNISATRTFAHAHGRASPVANREYASELTRNSTPETIPIQCSRVNAGLTTDPAMCREGKTANKIGVMETKNKMPPTHATSDKDMM